MKSRFKGVSWSTEKQKWRASIKIDYRARHLGYFADEADAARAYGDAAKEAWGDLATFTGRLFSQLVIDPSGCLLWTGAKNKDGYGRIKVNGRWRSVHQVTYELFDEPVPEGMELDHVKARGCRYRHCASLAHLEPVTHRENLLRGESPSAIAARVTHCPQNHEYDLLNTRWDGGSRHCRACDREQHRSRYYARMDAEAGDGS